MLLNFGKCCNRRHHWESRHNEDRWICFLVKTPNLGLAKNSKFTIHVTLHFYQFCRVLTKKLVISFIMVIVRIGGLRESTIQQTPPPWLCRLLLQRHGDGDGKSDHPNPRGICGTGWRRAGFKGFIVCYNLAKKKNSYC
jgi:hypothetical protein